MSTLHQRRLTSKACTGCGWSWRGRHQGRRQRARCRYRATEKRLTSIATKRDRRAYLEAGQAPVDELNRLLRLDARDSSRGVLGDDIATVEQAAGHVLALTGVALDHLVAGLEAREGHLRDGVLLMVGLVRGEEGRERRDREVDTREGDEVGLELVQVDVQRAIETERRRDRGDNLSDQAVQVREAGLGDVELVLADIEDRLVVDLFG